MKKTGMEKAFFAIVTPREEGKRETGKIWGERGKQGHDLVI